MQVSSRNALTAAGLRPSLFAAVVTKPARRIALHEALTNAGSRVAHPSLSIPDDKLLSRPSSSSTDSDDGANAVQPGGTNGPGHSASALGSKVHDSRYSQLSVLVVEDNSINNRLASHMLHKLHVRNFETAADGVVALEQLKVRYQPSRSSYW
jgi:hypothetical protein